MSLGRVAIFAAGALVGGVIGLAASKSPAVEKATKSTIKAGIRAKDWTVNTYNKAKDEVKAMAKDAKAKKSVKKEAAEA